MKRRWHVYMLECANGALYTGIALDVAARFAKHASGKGAAYTRANPPRRIVASQRCASLSEALKLEYALKQLPRRGKLVWAASRRPLSRSRPTYAARSARRAPGASSSA